MRVLMVLPTAIMGGAERVLFNLAYELLAQGNDVVIYIMSRGKHDGWTDLQSNPSCRMIVRDFASEKTSLISFFCGMYKISRESPLELVMSSHTHVNAALSFLRFVNVLKCNSLVSRESTFIFERFFGLKRFIFWVFYKWFYGSQDALIFQTAGMKASLESALKFKPVKKSLVLENPVSQRFIDTALKQVPQTDFTHIRIVACGRLIPIKGFAVLLESFSNVVPKFPNSVLEIIGDGPDRASLEALVLQLGLTNKVIFHGWVSNPFVYYRGATLGVVSSVKEGFPNVLIEMMACGVKSLVTTPCTDGVYSLPMVKVADGVGVDSLSKAICSVLDDYVDNSVSYRSYVKSERSVTQFLARIFKSLS